MTDYDIMEDEWVRWCDPRDEELEDPHPELQRDWWLGEDVV